MGDPSLRTRTPRWMGTGAGGELLLSILGSFASHGLWAVPLLARCSSSSSALPFPCGLMFARRWRGAAGGCGAAGVDAKCAQLFGFPFPPRCAIQRGVRPCQPEHLCLLLRGWLELGSASLLPPHLWEAQAPLSSGLKGCWGLTRGDPQRRDLIEKSQGLKSSENAALFVHSLVSAVLGLSILRAGMHWTSSPALSSDMKAPKISSAARPQVAH